MVQIGSIDIVFSTLSFMFIHTKYYSLLIYTDVNELSTSEIQHTISRNVNSFRIPLTLVVGGFFCALKNRSPDEVSEQRFKSSRRSGA